MASGDTRDEENREPEENEEEEIEGAVSTHSLFGDSSLTLSGL
jgi:hypothetical protein